MVVVRVYVSLHMLAIQVSLKLCFSEHLGGESSDRRSALGGEAGRASMIMRHPSKLLNVQCEFIKHLSGEI